MFRNKKDVTNKLKRISNSTTKKNRNQIKKGSRSKNLIFLYYFIIFEKFYFIFHYLEENIFHHYKSIFLSTCHIYFLIYKF